MESCLKWYNEHFRDVSRRKQANHSYIFVEFHPLFCHIGLSKWTTKQKFFTSKEMWSELAAEWVKINKPESKKHGRTFSTHEVKIFFAALRRYPDGTILPPGHSCMVHRTSEKPEAVLTFPGLDGMVGFIVAKAEENQFTSKMLYDNVIPYTH